MLKLKTCDGTVVPFNVEGPVEKSQSSLRKVVFKRRSVMRGDYERFTGVRTFSLAAGLRGGQPGVLYTCELVPLASLKQLVRWLGRKKFV